MDHKRSNPGAIGRNNPQATQSFNRAYKACIHCRVKKAKCSITAEEYSAGLPCSKCRREMRSCAFTTERHGPYQRGRRASQQSHDSQSREGPTKLAPAGQSSPEVIQLDTSPSHTSPSVREQTADHGLADTMMTTIVSNGNDALNLLFEAARQDEGEMETGRDVPLQTNGSTIPTTSPALPTSASTATMLPQLPPELVEIWNAYRFVRMGWLSAEEAVWLVDMFFQNLAPFTPVLDEYYHDHANHYSMITQEPLLTCMILTISSRCHVLPTVGGQSRGYLIHQRLWDHCQSLLMRIVLGLEKGSKAKTRTLGSIEALLLLTEWHPRAMHAPPPADGWDSDVIFTMKDMRDQNGGKADSLSRKRWREDVIEPAKRSDRMCWMILGIVMSLASELGVFDENNNATPTELSQYQRRQAQRRDRLSRLIYVYQEQLCSRLGRPSMMTSSTSHAISYATSSSPVANASGTPEWRAFMGGWMRLTKIVRSISDLLFPSAAITNQMIQSGRYIAVIEHVQSLLVTWSREHSSVLASGTHFHTLLTMEFQSARLYTYSLGVQAIVSRTLAESNSSPSRSTCFNLTSTDLTHIQEVVDSALTTLRLAVQLSNSQFLRSCPIKVFLNITTASVFLLKALGLGVSPTQLRTALDVLKEVIAALKDSTPDDLHLSARYATLLEVHLTKLQANFTPSSKHPDAALRLDQQAQIEANSGSDLTWPVDLGQTDFSTTDAFDQDWLTLPLDASLVPYEMGDFQGLQCLGDGTLDFLWNLGT